MEPNPKIVDYIDGLPMPWKGYAARYAHWLDDTNQHTARQHAESMTTGMTDRSRFKIRRDIFKIKHGQDDLIRAMTLGGGI